MLAAGIGSRHPHHPDHGATVAEDALRAVPVSLREAIFGVGAKRSTTSFRVVVPAAISGIVAAFIISACREPSARRWSSRSQPASTAAGLFSTLDPLEPGQTMTAAMADAAGSAAIRWPATTSPSRVLFFVGLLLFLITLALNFVGDKLVHRVREEY